MSEQDVCANCGKPYACHEVGTTICIGSGSGAKWFPKKLADAITASRGVTPPKPAADWPPEGMCAVAYPDDMGESLLCQRAIGHPQAHWAKGEHAEYSWPQATVETVQEKWECSAHKPNYFGGDPQDCNWPHCGCDPHVDRVISGLEECGYEITPPRPLEPKPAPQVEEVKESLAKADRTVSEWSKRKRLEAEATINNSNAYTEYAPQVEHADSFEEWWNDGWAIQALPASSESFDKAISRHAWNAAKSQSLPVVEKLVSLDEVLTLIENEPVLPVELPDEIKQRLNGLYLELALGIAVVGTKNSLTHKLRKLSGEKETGRDVNQATPEEVIANFLANPLGEINADDVAEARRQIEEREAKS